MRVQIYNGSMRLVAKSGVGQAMLHQNSVKAFKKAVRNLDQKVNGTSIHKDDK